MEQGPQKEKLVDIREAIAEDLPNILAMLKETWLATYPNKDVGITEEDVLEMQADDSTQIEQLNKFLGPNHHLWVAEEDGNIVGMCGAQKNGELNRIELLYILPSYQGRGVGGRLAEQCLNWLGKDADIFVDAYSGYQPAMNFYQKLGFEVLGPAPEEEEFTFSDGRKFPILRMRKATQKG